MKKLYLEVSRPEMGSYIQSFEEIGVVHEEVTEMQYGELGEKLILELVEMEEEDYKKLPEFIGW